MFLNTFLYVIQYLLSNSFYLCLFYATSMLFCVYSMYEFIDESLCEEKDTMNTPEYYEWGFAP